MMQTGTHENAPQTNFRRRMCLKPKKRNILAPLWHFSWWVKNAFVAYVMRMELTSTHWWWAYGGTLLWWTGAWEAWMGNPGEIEFAVKSIRPRTGCLWGPWWLPADHEIINRDRDRCLVVFLRKGLHTWVARMFPCFRKAPENVAVSSMRGTCAAACSNIAHSWRLLCSHRLQPQAWIVASSRISSKTKMHLSVEAQIFFLPASERDHRPLDQRNNLRGDLSSDPQVPCSIGAKPWLCLLPCFLVNLTRQRRKNRILSGFLSTTSVWHTVPRVWKIVYALSTAAFYRKHLRTHKKILML